MSNRTIDCKVGYDYPFNQDNILWGFKWNSWNSKAKISDSFYLSEKNRRWTVAEFNLGIELRDFC